MRDMGNDIEQVDILDQKWGLEMITDSQRTLWLSDRASFMGLDLMHFLSQKGQITIWQSIVVCPRYWS